MDLSLGTLRKVLFLCVFAGLSLAGGPVLAQKILQTYDKPLPDIALIEPAQLEAKTTLHKGTPMSDPALAYTVRLSKDWTKQDSAPLDLFGLSPKIMTELERYYGPPQPEIPRSYFRVQAMTLDYQTTALQWFLPWAQEAGLNLEGMATTPDGSVEALYITVEGDTTYAVRMLAQINGKNLVVAEYYIPPEAWEDEKAMQATAIHSFAFVNPKKGLIEEMKTHTFLDLAEFSYPVSWELEEMPIRSADHMSARLMNRKSGLIVDVRGRDVNALIGQIDVNLIASYVVDSLPDEIEKFKKDLETTGLTLSDVIEKKTDYKLDDDMKFALVEVYKANDMNRRLQGYELWLAVMSSGDYYYFITLLTPSRDDDYSAWAKNTESFRLVLESTKLHDVTP